MIFVKEMRCQISSANPNMPVLQIMKEVGIQWKALDPQVRSEFQHKADIDKIRYKEELKEFEKEVEKLQVCNPKAKNSKKQPDSKLEISSEILEEVKSASIETKPNIIEIEDMPNIVSKKLEQNLLKFNDTISKSVGKVDKHFNEMRNRFDERTTVDEKTMPSRESAFIRNQSAMGSIKTQDDKEPIMRPHIFQNPLVRNDNLIKRPMNVSKPDPNFNYPKPGGYVLPNPNMGYKMTADTGLKRQINDYEGVTLASPINRNIDYNSWPEK
jgi:hypothetical protein